MIPADVIESLVAHTIYDSRGKPTIEIILKTKNSLEIVSSVPSGASTGVYEALELRDKDASEHMGQGVSKALENINSKILPELIKSDVNILDQKALDNFLLKLDGTPNKANLGANAILAVSMVFCKYAAAQKCVPLFKHLASLSENSSPLCPLPFLNVINGGAHAGNSLAFQEFMIVPTGANTFEEAMRLGTEVYQHLKILIKAKYGPTAINVGDEGGFAPDLDSPQECLELLEEAVLKAGHQGNISFALDVAASEFYQKMEDGLGKYNISSKSPKSLQPQILSGKDLAKLYIELSGRFPIISIEDPFDQDDWESWKYLRENLKKNVQIVGDDLTVTNCSRIEKAIHMKACNSLLLKVNQIGTITESIAAAKLAFENGWSVMVSHRSGETEDSFIADLAVGLSSGQIKSGAPCRSERLCKYNRILRISKMENIPLKKWA